MDDSYEVDRETWERVSQSVDIHLIERAIEVIGEMSSRKRELKKIQKWTKQVLEEGTPVFPGDNLLWQEAQEFDCALQGWLAVLEALSQDLEDLGELGPLPRYSVNWENGSCGTIPQLCLW